MGLLVSLKPCWESKDLLGAGNSSFVVVFVTFLIKEKGLSLSLGLVWWTHQRSGVVRGVVPGPHSAAGSLRFGPSRARAASWSRQRRGCAAKMKAAISVSPASSLFSQGGCHPQPTHPAASPLWIKEPLWACLLGRQPPLQHNGKILPCGHHAVPETSSPLLKGRGEGDRGA